MTQAVDFVTAPDPAELQGLFPLPYTGNARPSQGWFDDCRARGVAPIWMTQETISTRSQEGFQAGVYDCRFAEARARQRGHDGAIAVVVSDGNSRDAWDASGYGRGWASVATLPFFPYGALGVTSTFLAGAVCPLLMVGEWVPETWGAGRIASQLVGAQAPISTPHDLNTVYADFGAPIITTEDDMIFKAIGASTTNPAVTNGSLWVICGTDLLKAEDYAAENPSIVPFPVGGEQLGQVSVKLQPQTATGQGGGPSDAQRAAVDAAVAVLSANGAGAGAAAHDLATAFG